MKCQQRPSQDKYVTMFLHLLNYRGYGRNRLLLPSLGRGRLLLAARLQEALPRRGLSRLCAQSMKHANTLALRRSWFARTGACIDGAANRCNRGGRLDNDPDTSPATTAPS